MLRKDNISAVILFLIFGLVSSCTGRTDEFSAFRNIPESGWAYSHALTFAPEHADSVSSGPLYLTMRHGDAYPYSNIYLEVSAGGEKDTVRIQLADVYGNWLGKGLGASREVTVMVRDRFVHHTGDTVTVRHILRTDTLQGVDMIGIQLNP